MHPIPSRNEWEMRGANQLKHTLVSEPLRVVL